MTTNDVKVENRMLAALSHAAVVVQGMGVLVGVLVYYTEREKSRYASFQGLQAAIYQLVGVVAVVVLWVVWGIAYTISIFQVVQVAEANADAPPPPLFWLSLVGTLIPIGFMVLIGLYGLWGALRTWQGKDFRYFLIGDWVAQLGLWNTAATNEAPPPE